MAMPTDELTYAHQALNIDLDRLRLVASSADGALPESRMRAVVVREVLDLCAVLAQHFAAEEAVVGRSESQRASVTLAKLREDHHQLLEYMHGLAEVAPVVPMDVLKLRISDALDALAEHELAESQYTQAGPPAAVTASV